MNPFLTTAAVLAFLAGIIHSTLGERLIFSSLDDAALPSVAGSSSFTKRVLRLFWHLLTAAWWGFAIILWLLAGRSSLQGPIQTIAIVIGSTFLASAVGALVGSRGKHFSWAVLALIAVCVWLGLG